MQYKESECNILFYFSSAISNLVSVGDGSFSEDYNSSEIRGMELPLPNSNFAKE